MPMTEDFNAFFNVDEHGSVATFDSTQIVGIFEDQFLEVDGVESLKPTFTCAEADVPGVTHGIGAGAGAGAKDSITINAVKYRIVGHQPDGTGLIMLVLGNY